MKKPAFLRRTLSGLLLCLLAAAVAVAAVAVADLVEDRYGLRTDLSFNHITTESAATKNVLLSLERNVHVYAVYSEGNELTDLSALLDRYQATGSHFTWSRENLAKNPLLLQWASDSVTDSGVTTDCLIVRCEETGRTRVLTWDDYIGYGYDTESGLYQFTGLTYEKSLTEAILYVTSDEVPRVQLLSGHGELTSAETQTLEQKLRQAGYEVARVDLKAGGAPDPSALLMILSPTMDVTEEELASLMEFANAGGSLFVTVDFTDPDELPNLYAFYRLYGVEPLPGLVVADSADRTSFYSHVSQLTPIMRSSGVTDTLISAQADYVILAPARALELVSADSALLTREVVLQSGDTAYIRTAQGDTISMEREEGDPAGPFALAVLCSRVMDGGLVSRAFFIGNSGAFLSEQLYSMTYSQELLLQVTQYLRGGGALDLDIVARDAARPEMDVRGAVTPLLLLTVPPFLVAVVAMLVLRPRRYL
ncbi:MAG: Gldg family protein [Clostridia bacterium]|nr:Gldg family protein [Clostridia bacterium]